ncbi:MAG: hypothetical protein ACRDRI_11895 [Pseudonocardiaceae bacterium]
MDFTLIALAVVLLVGVLIGCTVSELLLGARTRRQAAMQRSLNSQQQELARQRQDLLRQRRVLTTAQHEIAR